MSSPRIHRRSSAAIAAAAFVALFDGRPARAAEVTVAQQPVSLGATAPDFSLPDQDGHEVRLSTLLGDGPVVVFFYPRDGTPGCTKEACAFRDAYDAFLGAGCRVVGISGDGAAAHTEFRGRHNLRFPLLTDAGGRVAKAWGVKKTLGLMPGRATFVLDRKGVVRHHFVGLLQAERHVETALEFVRTLKRDP